MIQQRCAGSVSWPMAIAAWQNRWRAIVKSVENAIASDIKHPQSKLSG
jgi:hypothetical protein